MKISVIIPCYNCEKTIQKTIDSLNKQTIKPTEIICVNDGSTDNTSKIIKTNKKIIYLSQKNSGPAKARNTGAKKAVGEIILFTDSDCVLENNWIKEMIKPFKNKKVVGVQGAYKTTQKELIANFVQEEIEERYERMKRSNKLDWVGSYSAAFRKKEFFLAGGYDESFPIASGEDPEFSFRIIKKTKMKLEFNDKAIVYHSHPNTLKKYLKTKYFRAVYRPKMYANHKEKIIKDSYTPQKIKIEILLFYVSLIFLIIGFANNLFWILIIGLIIIHTILELTFLLKIKNPKTRLITIPITMMRAIVFGIGLIHGTVKKNIKK